MKLKNGLSYEKKPKEMEKSMLERIDLTVLKQRNKKREILKLKRTISWKTPKERVKLNACKDGIDVSKHC